MTLLEAMAHMEGFFINGDRPNRNHNPGDLEWGPETARFGALHGDPRFAVFPDVKTGWKAFQSWLSIPARFDSNGALIGGYCGATLQQVIDRFAPPNENNSTLYINFVSKNTGITPETVVTAGMLVTPEET